MRIEISTKGAIALLAVWIVGRPMVNAIEHAAHKTIRDGQTMVNGGRLNAPKRKQVGFIGSVARQQNR